MTVVRAVGMMSGTSLDGVDFALIETDGVRIAGIRSDRLPALFGGGTRRVAATRSSRRRR